MAEPCRKNFVFRQANTSVLSNLPIYRIMHIFHITEQSTWDGVQENPLYEGGSLKSDGFIHCCLFDQIEDVLGNWFAGKHRLVILEIDAKKMTSPVKYENFEGGSETFPHVYGPINIDAVVNVKLIK